MQVTGEHERPDVPGPSSVTDVVGTGPTLVERQAGFERWITDGGHWPADAQRARSEYLMASVRRATQVAFARLRNALGSVLSGVFGRHT